MRSPITGKYMYIIDKIETIIYKGELVCYCHKFFYCKDSSEEFTTTELDEENLKEVERRYKEEYEKETD